MGLLSPTLSSNPDFLGTGIGEGEETASCLHKKLNSMAVHPCPLRRGEENQGRPGATFEIASRIIRKARRGRLRAGEGKIYVTDGTAAVQPGAFRERTAGWWAHRLNGQWFEPNHWREERFR